MLHTFTNSNTMQCFLKSINVVTKKKSSNVVPRNESSLRMGHADQKHTCEIEN